MVLGRVGRQDPRFLEAHEPGSERELGRHSILNAGSHNSKTTVHALPPQKCWHRLEKGWTFKSLPWDGKRAVGRINPDGHLTELTRLSSAKGNTVLKFIFMELHLYILVTQAHLMWCHHRSINIHDTLKNRYLGRWIGRIWAQSVCTSDWARFTEQFAPHRIQ